MGLHDKAFKISQIKRKMGYDVISRYYDIIMCHVYLIDLLSFILYLAHLFTMRGNQKYKIVMRTRLPRTFT